MCVGVYIHLGMKFINHWELDSKSCLWCENFFWN